ncbi:Crp/Fnr family transcriptional regulator [Bradyrhizobium sp. S3.9.1]|uniref:Crp/Fnr family transcriptional regulator n=1 Tax=Bradyrhizobium sp. S3.9.1 TaxID=3156431 RepID=UPI0033943946
MSDDDAASVRQYLATPAPGKRIKHYRKGALLYEKGTKIKEVHLISLGQIRVDAISHGRTTMIRLAGPQDWLLEGALGDVDIHTNTATAQTDADCFAFAREAFPGLLARNPAFGRLFMEGLAKTTSTMSEAIDNQVLNPAVTRMAHWFLKHCTGSDAQEVLIETTPSRLGERIGVTRQTAHKLINFFIHHGVLTKRDSDNYILHRAELGAFLSWVSSSGKSSSHELAHYNRTKK